MTALGRNEDWLGGMVPILIVSYRTPGDIRDCLASLDALQPDPPTAIFICENGGRLAWEALCRTLLAPDGGCISSSEAAPGTSTRLISVASLALAKSGRSVFIGQANGNLGYAGGINAWLEPLMKTTGWTGCWILNPDAIAAPDSLAALLREAERSKLGMTASRLTDRIDNPRRSIVGLRWQRVLGRTAAVVPQKARARRADTGTLVRLPITAGSGASVYVTRSALDAMAPFDERYFLFFEDLDWGIRATTAGYGVGYAYDSVVAHLGGGSTGTKSAGAGMSRLSVYLQFRNRMLFVQTHYPRWFIYTGFMSALHATRVLRQGAFMTAIEGIGAGLRGETGCPDWLVEAHVVPHGSTRSYVATYETVGS